MKLRLTALCLGFAAITSVAQIGPPPVILVQPLGLSVPKLGTAVLTVVAASVTTASYQWYKDGAPISGATTSVLLFDKVQTGDAGAYHVVVRNASGTARSASATLLITEKIKVQLPIKLAKKVAAGFELQLEGLSVPQCVVYASDDMQNWVPIATNAVTSGSIKYTDVTANQRTFRFYKVMDE